MIYEVSYESLYNSDRSRFLVAQVRHTFYFFILGPSPGDLYIGIHSTQRFMFYLENTLAEKE